MKNYRIIDHTADLGAEFYGADPAEVMVNSALALFELMLEDRPTGSEETLTLSLEADDRAELLVHWLSELIYLFQVREKVLVGVRIQDLTERSMTAELSLAAWDPERFGPPAEIKAATYHGLEFGPRPGGGWRARVIFDL